MKTISIGDLRQRWPEAEAALATECVLIITRDGKPVAKLIRFEDSASKRKRFNPCEHNQAKLDPSFFDPLPEDELDRWEGK